MYVRGIQTLLKTVHIPSSIICEGSLVTTYNKSPIIPMPTMM